MMLSIVIDVSAMLVASTTLRAPRGGRAKIARCAPVGSAECSGSKLNRAGSP